ncbi:MAG: trigger factor [Actinomycetota bacterium]|nr:trigger factor [Actinomycetota bacterium]
MKTSVEPLEGNKVKLSVEVDEDEFDKALDAAFRRIAKEVRVPGFRPGKAPRKILEARVGPEAARQEALRESLPEYYAKAVGEHEVDVIAPPEIDITAGEADGPLVFDAVVEVRPRITVPGYGGLRVEVPSPEADEAAIDAQVERLRAQSGELVVVDRPAQDGDHVTIDVAGSVDGEPVDGLTADDYLYELGSDAVVPELDEHLRSAQPGDVLVFDAEHPDPEEESTIAFRVLVKDVKEQVLPEVDDEWANEASEFETVEALRDDLRTRLSAIKRVQTQMALRDGVIAALVALIEDEAPEPLVEGEVERRADDLQHRLSHQGASIQQYLEATGTTGEALIGQLRDQAVDAVKADLGLRAVAEAEQLEATDDEVDAEIARIAERVDQPVAAVRLQLERAEQLPAVRSDLRRGKALEWLVEHAEVVDEDGKPVDRALLQPPEALGEPDADEHLHDEHTHDEHTHDEHTHDEHTHDHDEHEHEQQTASDAEERSA